MNIIKSANNTIQTIINLDAVKSFLELIEKNDSEFIEYAEELADVDGISLQEELIVLKLVEKRLRLNY